MMNEMKRFEAPALQVIALDPTDVIATSTKFDTVVKAVRFEDVVDKEKGGVSTPNMQFDPNA